MPQKIEEKRTNNSKQRAKTPQEKLAEYLATHDVKIARTPEELYAHSFADDNGEEIDDFLRLREEWRRESRDRSIDLD